MTIPKSKGKKLAAKGRGEAKPVAPNINPDGSDNPEGRQKNRRVEVTVKKQGAAESLGTFLSRDLCIQVATWII